MLRKVPTWIAVIGGLVLGVALSLADSKPYHPPPPPRTCRYEYTESLRDYNSNILETAKTSFTVKWTEGTERLYGGSDFFWIPQILETDQTEAEAFNKKVAALNEGLQALYVNQGFVLAPAYRPFGAPFFGAGSVDPCYGIDGTTHWDDFPTSIGTAAGYTTSTRINGTTTSVTVTSPKGSSVDYYFPTAWLDTIYQHALGKGPALKLDATFSIPQVTDPNANELTTTILQNMANAEQNSREGAMFTLNISDFEGRRELKPVLAKAMYIAAAQEQGPVMATIHSMLSNDQRMVGSVSGNGSSSITSHGWWFLGTGALNSSGGGGYSFQASYSSWFEDVVRGSIYITPAPQ